MRHIYAGRYILWIFLLALFSVLWINQFYEMGEYNTWNKMRLSDGRYRAKFFSKELWEKESMLSDECKSFMLDVENEVTYYPIPESTVDKALTVSQVNTWMSERAFGGKRGHEGTDIMAAKNKRGVYPVLSMTDGHVTNIGWLEKGGYRVGVTSDSGTYYYYAHLDSYGNIKNGDEVKAGELLGYMGDTGYGEEGTKEKFPVHLHVGIYTYRRGREISVNPYYVLEKLKNNKLKYSYF